ncbi:MAG: methyltransferase family protein [Anaerolineae bacterium]
MTTSSYDYGLWFEVFYNLAFVLLFALSFLVPKRRVEWRSMGLFGAWLVALFTEMFGFPLTIYALTALLGRAYPVLDPFSHKNGHLLVALAGGSETIWMAVMLFTMALFWAGIVVMAVGWRRVHRAQGALVTDGIYAWLRHPQYAGLFMVIVAFLIQWPTIPTLLMAPALFRTYIRLARREEREMEERFGEAYRLYKTRVPGFIPRLDVWRMSRGGTRMLNRRWMPARGTIKGSSVDGGKE